LRREGDTLRLAPCLPAHWPGFKLRYRYGDTVYRIAVVSNASGSSSVTVDGVEQPDHAISMVDDHREHVVAVSVAG
jgi:cyclic beta-1,2-glucan glucanotransferase